MPDSYISKRIKAASWRSLGIWFALLMAYSFWAFGMDSPWTRALEAGGGTLPEMTPGFPPVEPARTLERLSDSKTDYVLWQIADAPYAILNILVFTTAISLGLKKAGLDGSPLRWLTFLPLAYGFGEIVENSLLTAFTLEALAPHGWGALVQQGATTLKHFSAFGAIGVGLISLLLAALLNVLRKSKNASAAD